jgi:glyoxylase-like metal-dependent hydrolase (beta-lactamase superfamily II)
VFDKLWIFHCGYIRVPRGFIFKGGGFERIPLPFMAAVARHTERGPILFDAPFGRQGPTSLGRAVAGMLQTLGFEFQPDWAVVPRLEAIGLRPAEIEHVCMTHLHVDHTGAMKTLADPTFHVADAEWQHVRGLGSIRAAAEGYVPDDYRTLEERVETFETPESLSTSDDRTDLFGDGSLQAIGLPGHTPGHVGYELQFEGGETALHVGDAAFGLSQITERDDFGYQPRMFAHDLDEAERTLEALRRHVDAHPEVFLVNAHDWERFEQCREGPIALIE